MKKFLAAVSTILATVTVLSIPASAIAILTGDSFGKASDENWVTDHYDPEEFDNSNQLYLAVGKDGYYKNRPADKKSKYYALQGKKLEVKTPTKNTWTATVKLEVDETWFSSSGQKRAEFRVDLVDGNGDEIETSPAIALVKGGSGAPVWKFVNPAIKNGGWGTGNKFINGDKESEDLYVEEGWHTLLIKANDGVLTYYINEKKIGNCTIDETDVYPSFMALNAYNYERPDVISFDNCYLYDGSYVIRQLSSEAKEKKEDRLEEQYAKKRASWIERYTQYQYNSKWYKESDLPSGVSIAGLPSRLTKEMPDSYYNY